jgi:hypothetical protein
MPVSTGQPPLQTWISRLGVAIRQKRAGTGTRHVSNPHFCDPPSNLTAKPVSYYCEKIFWEIFLEMAYLKNFSTLAYLIPGLNENVKVAELVPHVIFAL